jgi:thiamine-phosphate pyrophosphorylase
MHRPLGAVHLILDLDRFPRGAERLESLLEAGLPSVQLRAKRLSTAQRVSLGAPVAELVRSCGARFVMNEDLDAAVALGADGVHLPARAPGAAIVRGRLGAGALVGRSAHDAGEVRSAEGCDWVLLSPVFATPSKPGRLPLGLRAFRALAGAARTPVYALGGIDATRLDACFAAGAAGVAAVGALLAPDGEDLVRAAIARFAGDGPA